MLSTAVDDSLLEKAEFAGGRAGIGGGSLAFRHILVASEMALATVLLVGAGLLLQSMLHLQQVQVGFHPEGVLTFHISPPAARYPNQQARWTFFQRSPYRHTRRWTWCCRRAYGRGATYGCARPLREVDPEVPLSTHGRRRNTYITMLPNHG